MKSHEPNSFSTRPIFWQYTDINELEKMVHPGFSMPMVVIKEFLDNACDACEKYGDVVGIKLDKDSFSITNAGVISFETLKLITDFSILVSEKYKKFGFQRGSIGHGLKIAIMMGISDTNPFIIESGNSRYTIKLKNRKSPNPRDVLEVEHSGINTNNKTTIKFRDNPVYHIIVPVRSFGQLGIRVSDSRAFVTQIVGTLHDWKADKVSNYFKGLVVTQTKDCVAKFMVDNKVSVMDIAPKLDEISKKIGGAITDEFSRFGLEIVNFFVMSINVPDDDPSVMKIQEIMASRAEFEQLGDYYKVKRTFDTLEKAAENEGGAAGALLSGGLGVGMGVGAGASMGANLGSLLSTQGNQSREPNDANAQSPEERLLNLKTLLDKGLISQDEFNEKRKKIIDEL